jgi:hypothetical protein
MGTTLYFVMRQNAFLIIPSKPKQDKSSITTTSQNSYKFKRMLTIISYNKIQFVRHLNKFPSVFGGHFIFFNIPLRKEQIYIYF